MFNFKTYRPAGPTLKRFHESGKFFRPMAGPVGSGKTAAAGCAEMVLGTMIQNPFPDGVRRAKFGVLRDSYRNLYSQFIPSWFEWFPREIGKFVGSDDRPAVHTFTMDTPVGPCETTVEMRALGPNSVENVCRGWNLTGAFLDEADLQPREAMSFLAGRVMRWPQAPYRVTKGVWCTFNKPDVDHWLYEMCVESPPEDMEFFDQPGGLLPGGSPFATNPDAENLARLDPDYYIKQAENNPEWYVRRMLRNQWGASVSGQAVYTEFDPDKHMSKVELEPEVGDELTLGLDGGGTPAAVVGGRTRTGRRRIYAEAVVADLSDPRGRRISTGVGAKRFAEFIGDVLMPRFSRQQFRLGYGDPAAFYGADREAGEYSFMETVALILKIPIMPAPSNETMLRRDALGGLMTRPNVYDRQPDLEIDPRCKFLRRGLAGDFKWTVAKPEEAGKRLTRQKTATSHVCEAAEYWALGDQGRAGVVAGRAFDRWQPKRSDGLEAPWERRPSGLLTPGQSSYDAGGGQGSYDAGFNLWKS